MHTSSEPTVGLYDCRLGADEQVERVRAGGVPVAVYGLGKMGLPLASVFADVTGNVTGVDIDPGVVESVNAGASPVTGEPGLDELVEESVATGALSATADIDAAARAARVHVVVVPTLVEDGTPDLSNIRVTAERVGAGLTPGDLVCIESTVPPGTCRDVVDPILQAESDIGADEYGLAFCPERTASGRALRDIRGAYPKIVGGRDEESGRAAGLLYGQITDNEVRRVADATTAECVKVFEGVYRDVNIALANELARLADELGVDVREGIAEANTQPYCDIHRPGPGVGGHCIPYYPYFLIDSLDTETPLLRTARSVNEEMPAYTARTVIDELAAAGIDPAEATVGVLGIAYRPGVDETRESPGLAVIESLHEAGVETVAFDPVVDLSECDVRSAPVSAFPDLGLDGAVLVTDHGEFTNLPWDSIDSGIVVDGRGTLDRTAHPSRLKILGDGQDG
ncbi:nucleotide sugar dehydrogenase [Halorientalis litorea]|uniref:nucleotide sugar dehydrogenase n=1 Tax=Halorientalis litorea TaxID=2931977 RepID=UPI001FF6D5B1|nr:nucleotide sugar dehydrogenase [Halorientalis litorea]